MDTDILTAANIAQDVIFIYDQIAFHYIVVWYSPIEHKNFYQLFIGRNAAIEFSNVLTNQRNRANVIFKWDSDDKAYNSIAGMP
jgi:hypothetical protein